jgi:aminoglycoside phosphotransferase (APT) family kinase protein
VETLVQIHAIEWSKVGLESFGHPEGFLARQVNRWIERYARAKTDDVPDVGRLVAWLTDRVPRSSSATLIHNDFKLNNVMWRADDLAQPVAVLDWEMATIGDPLFDLGIFLSYWVRPDDPAELQGVLPTVTTLPGFMERSELMELYALLTGRDLRAMRFYSTFAYFKLAVILQQIYVRWKRGQTRDERFAKFGERAGHLINAALRLASVSE